MAGCTGLYTWYDCVTVLTFVVTLLITYLSQTGIFGESNSEVRCSTLARGIDSCALRRQRLKYFRKIRGGSRCNNVSLILLGMPVVVDPVRMLPCEALNWPSCGALRPVPLALEDSSKAVRRAPSQTVHDRTICPSCTGIAPGIFVLGRSAANCTAAQCCIREVSAPGTSF